MSFMDSIGSFFSFGADKAAERAAEQQAQGYTQARGAIDAGEQGALSRLAKASSIYAPYAESGGAASQEQAALLGLLGPEAQEAARARFTTSPGYEFQFDEGQRALERGTAARGGLYSGSAGKALVDYGNGLASQEFGNHFSRLASLGSTGLSAASGQAGVETNAAGTISNAANARADALLGRSTALAGGTINAANARAQGWSNLLQLGGKIAGAVAGGGLPGGDVGLGSWGATATKGF